MSQKSCNFAPINIEKVMMKKYVLKILLLIAVSAICNSVLAETSTLTFTARCYGTGTADDGAKWTIISDGEETTYNSEKGIQYKNKSGNTISELTLSTSSIPGTITQVKVTASGNYSSYNTKVSVRVNNVLYHFNIQVEQAISNSSTVPFTGSASGDIQVKINQSPSKSPIFCKSIEVTYEADMQVQNGETLTVDKAQNVNNLEISEGGKVELSILRLAVYEILFDDDVPVGVAINEAVELSKKYGQDQAGSFVNGVLAKFADMTGAG